MTTPAVLALEDGTVFRGISIGAAGTSTGEVVFNTAMTGYQEILTDPSYSRQIVTLTYPHIGNTGTNPEDLESTTVHAAGLVIRDLPLAQFELARHGVAAGVPDAARHRRDRRNRHAQADAHPARERRAGRLHRQWRCRVAAGPGDRGGAPLSRASRAWTSRRSSCTDAPFQWNEGTNWSLEQGPRRRAGPAPARRRLRFRHQAQHPAPARRPRLPHDRRAGADARRRRHGDATRTACSCRTVPAIRSRARTRSTRSSSSSTKSVPIVRHLPRSPAARPRRRGAHGQDEVRPSRRESPGARTRDGPRDDHEPEPRFRGRRGDAAGERDDDAPLAVRRLAAGHRLHRSPGVQLPGPPRGEPGSARPDAAVRPIRRIHVAQGCRSVPMRKTV